MNRILLLSLISFFGIFVGSQITEGFLLAPYWKTLPKAEFYEYYAKFGPAINNYYRMLTISAVLIPISISIYCFFKKTSALKYSLVSTFFSLLILSLFFIYFKDANQQFYQANLNSSQLKLELETWECYHWLRVLFESISLIFLILTTHILNQKESTINS